jgi:hypothetical protein
VSDACLKRLKLVDLGSSFSSPLKERVSFASPLSFSPESCRSCAPSSADLKGAAHGSMMRVEVRAKVHQNRGDDPHSAYLNKTAPAMNACGDETLGVYVNRYVKRPPDCAVFASTLG